LWITYSFFRGDGVVVEDFPETTLILELMKTVQRCSKKKKTKPKRKIETNNQLKFDFQ
jgi:hypothetical protein